MQSFANTIDLEGGTDRLADPRTAGPWLTEAGLLATPGATVGGDELALARRVRSSLRSMLEHHDDGAHPAPLRVDALREVAAARKAQVEVGAAGQLEIRPERSGDLAAGLLRLLLIARDAQADGTWSRLRVCANDECRWVFYDRSRNRQGTWCRMEACGNRIKNRRLRARRR